MIPKYKLSKKELNSHLYSVSNNRLFLYRSTNTGFFNKWCGIWMPPFKMYEYFAFKIQEEWLSPQNVARFIWTPFFAAHHYELRGEYKNALNVSELLFAPQNQSSIVVLLKLTNKTDKELSVKIEAEVAANIRRKHEEFNLRKYESWMDDKRKCIVVKSEDDNFICFGTDFRNEALEVLLNSMNYYKEHYPSGELQRCYIPASCVIEFALAPKETYYLPLVLSAGFSKKDCMDSFDASIARWRELLRDKVLGKLNLLDENYFECDSALISTLFSSAVLNMHDFLYNLDSTKYLIAGYPWFLEAWDRDDLWSCFGLISLGEFKLASEIMKFFTKFRLHRMPCTVMIDKKKVVASYHGAGIDPLYLLVLDHLKDMSGKDYKDLISVEKEILRNLVLENYLVVHGPKETWMDSIERNGTAVEIQGMWVKAMERRDEELAKKLEKAFKNKFWNKELMYPFDSYSNMPDGSVTPNCFVPAMFGLYNEKRLKKIAERAKEELESEYGIRTLSCKDKKYHPASYHRGSTWGLTTLWGAALYLIAGNIEDATKLLEKLAKDLGSLHVGFVAETWDSENGNCVGATAQLWSTSLVPFVIDKYLLGIEWDKANDVLIIAPKIPSGWKRMKRGIKKVRDNSFILEISRVANGYELVLNFVRKSEIKCKILMPKNVKKIFVNGKRFEGREVLFEPQMKNVIRASI